MAVISINMTWKCFEGIIYGWTRSFPAATITTSVGRFINFVVQKRANVCTFICICFDKSSCCSPYFFNPFCNLGKLFVDGWWKYSPSIFWSVNTVPIGAEALRQNTRCECSTEALLDSISAVIHRGNFVEVTIESTIVLAADKRNSKFFYDSLSVQGVFKSLWKPSKPLWRQVKHYVCKPYPWSILHYLAIWAAHLIAWHIRK